MSEEKKNWVALFKHTQGWETVLHIKEYDQDYTLSGYCRLSEWVEITWKPLPFEEVRNGQINSLQQEKDELTAQFRSNLAVIEERLSKLLSLTGPEDNEKVSDPDDDIPF